VALALDDDPTKERSVKNLTWLLLILLAGCHDSKPTAPSPVPAPTVAAPAPVVRLVVPVITWGHDNTADTPGTTLRPSVAVSLIELADASGAVIARPLAGRHVDLTHWGWGWYAVRGTVNGVPSAWHQFELVPNPCGDCVRVPKPLPPPPVPCDIDSKTGQCQ